MLRPEKAAVQKQLDTCQRLIKGLKEKIQKNGVSIKQYNGYGGDQCHRKIEHWAQPTPYNIMSITTILIPV